MISPKEALFGQVEEMASTIPGWTPPDQLYTLFLLAYATSGLEGDILEIGSWCGRSTAVLGKAAQALGGTRVFALDLFPGRDDWKQNLDGSYSFSVTIDGKLYGGYQDQTVWAEPFERDIAPIYEKYDSVFDVFQETIRRNMLDSVVFATRGDSDVIARLPSEGYRLAFIDGDHSYDSVCHDIENVQNHLVPGGWICFDDAFSYYDGVNRAIEELVINSNSFELGQQMTRKMFAARKVA